MLLLSFLFLALIGCAFSQPSLSKRGKELLGFMVVCEKKGTWPSRPGVLGTGVYTLPAKNVLNADLFNANLTLASEFCAVYADAGAIQRVGKMWIPKATETTQFWGKPKNIDKHIGVYSLSGYDPRKTLRMSWKRYADWQRLPTVQLLIPETLLEEKDGHMGLSMDCKTTLDELPDEEVNYDNWHKNIGGGRGDDYRDRDDPASDWVNTSCKGKESS